MPGALPALSHLTLTSPHEVGTNIMIVLQMKTRRLGKVECLIQTYVTKKYQAETAIQLVGPSAK